VLYLTLSVVPYTQCCNLTQCCTLHSVLYLTLSVVTYTQCCTLHTVLYLTLSVVPYTPCLHTLPCAAHNQSAFTMFTYIEWKCVSITDTAGIARNNSYTALYKLAKLLTVYRLPVTICTTSLTFNNCTLCPHYIYVFCIYLRTKSDLCHLQHKLIGFYNRD
jgi:hypothetical protein